jgi:protein-S-isoprenylcysteine O-methyltransferase Ste14
MAILGGLWGLAALAGFLRLAWFAALMFATILINITVLAVVNPRLLRARAGRMRIEHSEERSFLRLSCSSMVLLLVITGLDAKFGWSSLGARSLWAGTALHVIGLLPILWTLATNPWAERSVRIQRDRAQQVVTTGPYRVVRHPMYLGVLIMETGWPLILGSLWAYLAVALVALTFARRALFEENLLRHELPGYADYMQRTRYRIVPGLW